MKKIVVAMDSMKGCLDSLSASKALADGITKHYADIIAVCIPVADGGEGTAEALAFGNSKFAKQISKVTGPLGGVISAEWFLNRKAATAFIDMASAAGLTLIDERSRNPMFTTTYGVGELILEAFHKGARKILLGLGGSATVDAGLGACQALGLRLLDKDRKELPIPFTGKLFDRITDYDISGFLVDNNNVELFLLCDVKAPFTGPEGAACVFGPQKGASPKEVRFLEKGMEHVRKMIISKNKLDLNEVAGSGAAGGTAGGLLAIAGGRICQGASLLLDAIGFDKSIYNADLIITGEGASDRQTLMGKIPFEILQRGRKRGIPVRLVAGRINDKEALLQAGFERTVCINSPEIIAKSGTFGMNPLDRETAIKRLGETPL